jgi:hypothetical protein
MSIGLLKFADLLAHPDRLAAIPQEAIPSLLGELERLKATLWARMAMNPGAACPTHDQPDLIDCLELATRWRVPESWIRDCVRTRSSDPIPCVRLGRYVRFQWNAPELTEWFERRKSVTRSTGNGSGKNRLTTHPISVFQ